MKISTKIIVLVSASVIFIASKSFALPMAGDWVTMYGGSGHPYKMVDKDEVAYQSFCLEKHQPFYSGGKYLVDVDEDYVTGRNTDGDLLKKYQVTADMKWLYAAFASNFFNTVTSNAGEKVQNAIWYLAGQITSKTDWEDLNAYRSGFDDVGWNVVAVNLTNEGRTYDNQSQLVGTAPVPEPATMLLFGVGLAGLAGVQRKRRA